MVMTANQSEEHALRPVTGEVGLLSQPDGSCMMCHGDTGIMAAVYGPVEAKISQEKVDKASVDVIYKPKVGLPGEPEKFTERIVMETCEAAVMGTLHPRTAINITMQEMQSSGGVLSCCINSACLALLDACVPLKYMIASVECIIDQDNKIVLDPRKTGLNSKAHMTFTFDSIDFNVVSCVASGGYSEIQYTECLGLCRAACKDIFQFYRDMLTKKLKSADGSQVAKS